MAQVKDVGFLLRKIPFSESSFILKTFTREHGLVSLVARGAKRAGSRWRGLLEPVLHLQFLFPEFAKSDLRTLGEVSLLRDFPAVRENPIKQGLARVFAEVLLRYAPSESDAAQFHDLLFSAKETLEDSPSERAVLQAQWSAFLLGYCALSGFQPQFKVCVSCGQPVSGANIPFLLDRGGPICSTCRREESAIHFLRENLFHWLDALQTGDEASALTRTEAWRAEEFLLRYLGRHAGGEKALKSLPVWHALLEDAS